MLYLIPVISALIGWVTNYIAVKMLFHPRKPVNLLIFKIQGVFPKRQKKLAERLGKIVATELFSIEDIKHKFEDPATLDTASGVVEERIEIFLNEKLAASMPMLAMFLNDSIKGKIKETLMAEFMAAFPQVMGSLADKIQKEVDIEKIVYDKVVNFSSDKFEDILFSIMKKEFRLIELLGGILGFIIGIIQVFIIKFGM